MSHFIKVVDPNPGWKGPLIAGWAGMRGVVSLAAALSIPSFISLTEPFPFRSLILFISFVVIIVTLVFQGLTLPWLIQMNKQTEFSEEIIRKYLGLIDIEEFKIRKGSSNAANL